VRLGTRTAQMYLCETVESGGMSEDGNPMRKRSSFLTQYHWAMVESSDCGQQTSSYSGMASRHMAALSSVGGDRGCIIRVHSEYV